MRHPHLFARLHGAAIMAHPKLRVYANKHKKSIGGMISHVESKFQQMTLEHGAGVKKIRKPLKFLC
jgi:hypothetical protein